MTKLRVNSFAVSLDGFGAGPRRRDLGYACTGHVPTPNTTHVILTKR